MAGRTLGFEDVASLQIRTEIVDVRAGQGAVMEISSRVRIRFTPFQLGYEALVGNCCNCQDQV